MRFNRKVAISSSYTAPPCLLLVLFCLMTMLCCSASRLHQKHENSTSILLEDFSDPQHDWREMNDPVMGGKSTGSFSVNKSSGTATFAGSVEIVWFLRAPGFIQARVDEDACKPFPDVSSCRALQLTLRSKTAYEGYRFSFGNAHAPGGKHFSYGYKTTLCNVPDDFVDMVLPFDEFTDFWDDATGDPIHSCRENEQYCPDEATLRDMKTMAIWGEGVAGKVSLEIKSIRAVNCSSTANANVEAAPTTCKDIAAADARKDQISSSFAGLRPTLLRGWSMQSAAPIRYLGWIYGWMFDGE